MDITSVETLPDETTLGGEPGSGLSPRQREVAELIVTRGLSSRQAAQHCPVPDRTIRDWYTKPAFKQYVALLSTEATTEATRRVKSIFTRNATEVAETIIRLGLGKGKRGRPSHPYQKDFLLAALDRVSGKPAQATIEAGIEVPTEHGPVRIIFKAEA